MESKTKLFEIPVSSSEFKKTVLAQDAGGEVEILFDYDEDGDVQRAGIRFGGVRAYRQRREIHCTEWHITDAYDSLVEVVDSEWAAEIRDDTAEGWKEFWTLRHFLIYFDSMGAYEVLAESWEPVGFSEASQS